MRDYTIFKTFELLAFVFLNFSELKSDPTTAPQNISFVSVFIIQETPYLIACELSKLSPCVIPPGIPLNSFTNSFSRVESGIMLYVSCVRPSEFRNMPLSSASIASIRSLLYSLSRGDIKQVLLEAGAKAERILPVLIINDIRSSKYLTKDTIISLLFDSIYADFEKDEADKVLLNLVHILRNKGIDISDIRNKLKIDGINLNDISSLNYSESAKAPSEFAGHERNKKQPLSQPENIREGKYTGSKISFDFQDADIVPIFRLLSDISGYNIVVSPEVRGKIALKLINVPWDQALDIILKTFSLGKSVEGNIIRIATLYVFAKESEEEVKTRIAELLVEPLETRVFHVSYADVAALEKTVKDLRILTPRGSISIDRRTSVIVVHDIPIVFPQLEHILSILDKPTPVNDSRKKDNVDATYEYDAFIWGVRLILPIKLHVK
jgi:hypothetical protein